MRVYFFQQVQFNLQLSEKEQIDRAKVVLPFEHQGTESGMLVCVYFFFFSKWIIILHFQMYFPYVISFVISEDVSVFNDFILDFWSL